MTIKEVCEALKVSDSTVRRAIKAEKLKSFKTGRIVRIEKQAVIDWLNEK